MREVTYQCSVCNFETELVCRGKDLFDKDGNKINFRRGCPKCGHTPSLTSYEIDKIVALAKD